MNDAELKQRFERLLEAIDPIALNALRQGHILTAEEEQAIEDAANQIASNDAFGAEFHRQVTALENSLTRDGEEWRTLSDTEKQTLMDRALEEGGTETDFDLGALWDNHYRDQTTHDGNRDLSDPMVKRQVAAEAATEAMLRREAEEEGANFDPPPEPAYLSEPIPVQDRKDRTAVQRAVEQAVTQRNAFDQGATE